VKENEEYIDAHLGPIIITAKIITSTNRRILMMRLKGHTYEYPKYFEQVSLTSTNKKTEEE
jgi:hypothetical protein